MKENEKLTMKKSAESGLKFLRFSVRHTPCVNFFPFRMKGFFFEKRYFYVNLNGKKCKLCPKNKTFARINPTFIFHARSKFNNIKAPSGDLQWRENSVIFSQASAKKM